MGSAAMSFASARTRCPAMPTMLLMLESSLSNEMLRDMDRRRSACRPAMLFRPAPPLPEGEDAGLAGGDSARMVSCCCRIFSTTAAFAARDRVTSTHRRYTTNAAEAAARLTYSRSTDACSMPDSTKIWVKRINE